MIKSPIYFPACGCTTTGYLAAPDSELIGPQNRVKSPRFFNSDEDSYYDHPYILLSAAHHFKKFPNIREILRISDSTKVFVDSGGYQLATGVVSHKNYNSKIALEWSEVNGDIFPILDHPVTPGCDPEERLKTSCESAKFYCDNRSAPNKQILNVVSGANIEAAQHWYKSIKKYKLDGLAHGGHRGVLTPIIQTFMMLGVAGEFNRGYTVPYHIFGVSTQVAFIYFAIMQQEANKRGWDVQIMSDSSSFQITLGHGNLMLLPSWTGIHTVKLSNKFDYSKIDTDARMPCDCPVCEGITDLKGFMTDPKQFYLLGVLHNLAMVLRYKKTVDNMVSCGVQEIVDESFPATVVKNIKAIRNAFVDPKKGIGMIYHTFNHRDVDHGNTSSLEDFFQ